MKQIVATFFAILSTWVGLALLFVGLTTPAASVIYGGWSENPLINVTFLIAAALGVFLIIIGARLGPRANKPIMVWQYWIAAAALLAFGIWMAVRLGSSLPTPSQAWLASMAVSRAHSIGQYPQIDKNLISQGRAVLAVTSGLLILEAALSGWVGRKWSRRPPAA